MGDAMPIGAPGGASSRQHDTIGPLRCWCPRHRAPCPKHRGRGRLSEVGRPASAWIRAARRGAVRSRAGRQPASSRPSAVPQGARAVSGLLALRPKATTRLASSCSDHTPSYSMSPMVIVADWWSGARSAVQRLFGPAPSHASCAAHRRWPETPSLSLRQPAGVAWLHLTPTHPCTPAALLAMQ